jgi:hypothetical protein
VKACVVIDHKHTYKFCVKELLGQDVTNYENGDGVKL